MEPESLSGFRSSDYSLWGTDETGQPDTGSYTYKWYLDGAVLTDGSGGVAGATTATVSFPSGSSLLTPGTHNLSVLVTAGSVLSSETIGFSVVAP